MLRFLSDLQIPPTSNQAERDLRPRRRSRRSPGASARRRPPRPLRDPRLCVHRRQARRLCPGPLRDALAGNAWMPPLPEIA